MLTHGGKAAEEAITGSERRFHVQVIVDWARDGKYQHRLSNISTWVESVTTDRSLSGSMPEELMLVEGASAAEMTVRLGGTPLGGMSWVAVFSPYNGNSPFYMQDIEGVEIKYRLGVETALGIVWYQQFVGNIRTITPDRGSDTVEITALDRVEQLRRPVSLPPFAVFSAHAAKQQTTNQLVDTQWVIDHCLRMCDTSPTPYRPAYREELNVPEDGMDGVQLWVSGTGGWLPTIGWLDNPQVSEFLPDDTPMYAQAGQRHPQVANDPGPAPQIMRGSGGWPGHSVRRYWAAARVQMPSLGGTHYAGFVLAEDQHATIADHAVMEVYVGMWAEMTIWVGNGKVWSRTRHLQGEWPAVESPKYTIPTGNRFNRIDVIWDYTAESGTRVLVKVNGQSPGFVTVYNGRLPRISEHDIEGRVSLTHHMRIADVYYAVRNIYNAGSSSSNGYRPAKYAAVLDKGLNKFSFTPETRNAEAWSIITEAAASEFGSVFWDEDGIFRFWNLDTILSKQDEVVRTFTIDDVSGLEMTRQLDGVRNIYSIETSKKRSRWGSIYQSSDPDEFITPGGTQMRHRLWIGDVLSPNPLFVRNYTTVSDFTQFPTWTDSVNHGCVLQWFVDGEWRELYRLIPYVTVHFNPEGYLLVDVFNPWPEPMRFATNSGEAAFRCLGTLIQDHGTQTSFSRDQESVTKYGGRNYTLSGEWFQDSFNADGLVDKLLARTSKPIPTTDAIEIAGDPRLQLGDTIEVLDPDGFGERMRLQILGIRREYSRDGGLTDTLTVELVRPAGIGLWDSPQYGRWDETFIWSD